MLPFHKGFWQGSMRFLLAPALQNLLHMKSLCFPQSCTKGLQLSLLCLRLQVLLHREDAQDGEDNVKLVDLNKLTRKDKEFIVERALEVSCCQHWGIWQSSCLHGPHNGLRHPVSGTAWPAGGSSAADCSVKEVSAE